MANRLPIGAAGYRLQRGILAGPFLLVLGYWPCFPGSDVLSSLGTRHGLSVAAFILGTKFKVLKPILSSSRTVANDRSLKEKEENGIIKLWFLLIRLVQSMHYKDVLSICNR